MLKPIFLYFCIVIGLICQVIPVGTSYTAPFFRIMYVEASVETECYPARQKGEVKYFYRIDLRDWIEWFSMYIVLFCVSILSLSESKKFKNIYQVFMALQLFNIIDYLITFNTGWFMMFGIVVTYKMFMCVILACSIAYELWGD